MAEAVALILIPVGLALMLAGGAMLLQRRSLRRLPPRGASRASSSNYGSDGGYVASFGDGGSSCSDGGSDGGGCG